MGCEYEDILDILIMENELQYASDDLVLKHKGKLLPENVDLKNIM